MEAEGCPLSSPSSPQPPTPGTPRGHWRSEAQNAGPREPRRASKGGFQWAQTPCRPVHRKALNSLTWGVWFSFINSNRLMFQLLGLLLQKLLYILTSPLPLLNSFLSVIWDAMSCTWNLREVCRIKHNSQLFRLCIFSFFSQQCKSPIGSGARMSSRVISS